MSKEVIRFAEESPKGAGHPSYPNPTIVEALCEIHFRMPPEKGWKSTLPGELFKRIQTDYPEMEPVTELGVQLEAGPQGLSHKILPHKQKFRFKHASGRKIIQLGENIFTVNILPPYEGWEKMKLNVLDAWRRAIETFNPLAITRIGLRYINRIERESNTEKIGEWLKPGDFIPPALLQTNSGSSRVQVNLDGQNRITVIIGDSQSESPDGKKSIILDIDRITEQEIAADTENMSSQMEILHEDVWGVFSSSKSEKLDHLLNGR